MRLVSNVIQLMGVDGEPIGLYLTNRTDKEQFQQDFDVVFEEASEMEEEQQSISHNEDWDLRTYVDEKLEENYKLVRVYAEEVTTIKL